MPGSAHINVNGSANAAIAVNARRPSFAVSNASIADSRAELAEDRPPARQMSAATYFHSNCYLSLSEEDKEKVDQGLKDMGKNNFTTQNAKFCQGVKRETLENLRKEVRSEKLETLRQTINQRMDVAWTGTKEGVKRAWNFVKESPGKAINWTKATIEKHPKAVRIVTGIVFAPVVLAGAVVASAVTTAGAVAWLGKETLHGALMEGHGLEKGIKDIGKVGKWLEKKLDGKKNNSVTEDTVQPTAGDTATDDTVTADTVTADTVTADTATNATSRKEWSDATMRDMGRSSEQPATADTATGTATDATSGNAGADGDSVSIISSYRSSRSHLSGGGTSDSASSVPPQSTTAPPTPARPTRPAPPPPPAPPAPPIEPLLATGS